ncbi:maltose alpha-D-glucosyltransferase/alpha-amylase [Curtobacterium luteum]|uniref:maltose alpha-D-glucosyltransferase n=1 Tax=Curtobacterium luteum TaxID=33881 RepID=A0A8H9G8A8_9MICO|nr:maltose alpha-D-glucosyltransferase [Curtobacterium luteum]MBM7801675.1 maltose alpha-D-glucosyltransferase/alpha-amylase [Curtobacterium luteum]NUU52003.1 maltose alpha-D-glucosyltransferase [Curtobacterium luteum]GGK88583.1 trehalose synthase/amylase TreS [Curtobacterium luteum]
MTFTAPIQLPGLTLDPQWYKRSVFYECMIRSFVDSNGDGIGDIQGVIGKLDYLQWLGVDAIWLPPFFQSPMRDGGYDIADYKAILPEFGTLDDFRELVTKSHERNMRIVIDMVINHTSDQHEWFQQSREDPDGPYGDFYVWRDTDQEYENIRIIFVDTEESNWTFDPVRRQFFFHRFFSHQPDLNFENPAVVEAVYEVVRHWLDMGVDGLRLDAIPYLFESEEGNGEGEPETHEFIKKLRAMVDDEYPGRVLLAEANQWPRETAAFFGTDEEPECHMAFDFPVMPRIFYSLRAQHASELKAILSETLDVPESAAWGVFLRNHDELTLEMVSEEYRQAMYGWYGYDPRMRSNIGIRRRLAPLLDNSRAELELIHALLFSLPGSPFLYYGDEIGMGDNIWLPDRDSSRTPMQWTPDRNAGFSTADPGKLYLPVVQSLVYNYQQVNVEAQLAQSRSLLHWVRNVIHVRKAHPVFGLGTLHVKDTSNESVLAFVRSWEGSGQQFGPSAEDVLCVFSFATNPTSVTISVPEYAGRPLYDLFGGSVFPSFDESGSVTLTLGTQSFYWLHVGAAPAVAPVAAPPASATA